MKFDAHCECWFALVFFPSTRNNQWWPVRFSFFVFPFNPKFDAHCEKPFSTLASRRHTSTSFHPWAPEHSQAQMAASLAVSRSAPLRHSLLYFLPLARFSPPLRSQRSCTTSDRLRLTDPSKKPSSFTISFPPFTHLFVIHCCCLDYASSVWVFSVRMLVQVWGIWCLIWLSYLDLVVGLVFFCVWLIPIVEIDLGTCCYGLYLRCDAWVSSVI